MGYQDVYSYLHSHVYASYIWVRFTIHAGYFTFQASNAYGLSTISLIYFLAPSVFQRSNEVLFPLLFPLFKIKKKKSKNEKYSWISRFSL